MPAADYLDSVRQVGGLLVIDDTQALGILGEGPDVLMPYGYGGGGSPRYGGIKGPDLVVISSLAKGLGVPVAILAGSQELVRHFEARSETRVHCSPPSAAVIHAAARAIRMNEAMGNARREQLVRRVKQFRTLLARAGMGAIGGLFPIQTLKLPMSLDPMGLHREMSARGVGSVLRMGHRGNPLISFIITSRHRPSEIQRAANAVATVTLTLAGSGRLMTKEK